MSACSNPNCSGGTVDRGAEVERLAEEWARGLADGQGRHVPVRRAWPELADLLDTLIDD